MKHALVVLKEQASALALNEDRCGHDVSRVIEQANILACDEIR
jgi:hypothetical protein